MAKLAQNLWQGLSNGNYQNNMMKMGFGILGMFVERGRIDYQNTIQQKVFGVRFYQFKWYLNLSLLYLLCLITQTKLNTPISMQTIITSIAMWCSPSPSSKKWEIRASSSLNNNGGSLGYSNPKAGNIMKFINPKNTSYCSGDRRGPTLKLGCLPLVSLPPRMPIGDCI